MNLYLDLYKIKKIIIYNEGRHSVTPYQRKCTSEIAKSESEYHKIEF